MIEPFESDAPLDHSAADRSAPDRSADDKIGQDRANDHSHGAEPHPPQLDSPIEPDLWQQWQAQVAQLAKALEGIPAQTDQALQQAIAGAQLQWGGSVRDAKDQLTLALASYRINRDMAALLREVDSVAGQLSPEQIEVIIRAIPGAMDRAVLASAFDQVAAAALALAASNESPPPSAPQDPDALRQVSARAYGLSGLPLVLDPEGSVDIETSAVLVTTLVAIQVAGATAGVALQLLGSSELKKLLASDAKLRRQILKKGGQTLAQQPDPDHLHRLLKDDDPPSDDGYLWLASLGIQGAQVAEVVGLQIRSIARSEWIRLAIPIPLVLEALQLLTSDLMLSLGTAVESNLEASSASRRIELVLEALPKAGRIPSPQQVVEQADAVLLRVEEQLRPLLARQLLKAAETFDPQLRNKTLNQLGQQLNLINPFQIAQGWSSREWVIRLRETLEDIWQDYPTLAVLQVYVVGLEDIQDLGRTMEQSQALRNLAKAIFQDSSEIEEDE